MIVRILKKFKIYSAKRVIEYDAKMNVIKGEAIESKPLSSYVRKGVGRKLIPLEDVTSHQTEDQVVSSCTKWLRSQGWECKTVFTGGIPIGQGRYATNPCKGIPDCIAFHPRTKRMIWIEYKKSKGGIVSFEQESWHILLKNSNQEVYIVTSLQSLKEQLDILTLDKVLKKVS